MFCKLKLLIGKGIKQLNFDNGRPENRREQEVFTLPRVLFSYPCVFAKIGGVMK